MGGGGIGGAVTPTADSYVSMPANIAVICVMSPGVFHLGTPESKTGAAVVRCDSTAACPAGTPPRVVTQVPTTPPAFCLQTFHNTVA